MGLKALTCPHCHSANVSRAADGTFRCQNCSTRLLLVNQLGQLVIPAVEGWLDCPRCGAMNDAGNFFCTRCGTEIRLKCPTCGTVRSAAEPICGRCGQTSDLARLSIARRAIRGRARRRGIMAGILVLGLMLACWMIIVVSLDWQNNQTVNGIATALCCLSPFGGLAVGAFVYLRQRAASREPS